MITKLTLTIQKDVIEAAKKYSRMKGKSISQIVETYLKTVIDQSSGKSDVTSPKVKKLMGSVQLPAGFDYKKSLSKAISKKYR